MHNCYNTILHVHLFHKYLLANHPRQTDSKPWTWNKTVRLLKSKQPLVDGCTYHLNMFVTCCDDMKDQAYLGGEAFSQKYMRINKTDWKRSNTIELDDNCGATACFSDNEELPIFATLDSGAGPSIMDYDTWVQLGRKDEELEQVISTLTAINAEPLDVKGLTPSLTLKIGGIPINMRFLVVTRMVKDEIVLGRDFLRVYDVHLDVPNNKAVMKNYDLKVSVRKRYVFTAGKQGKIYATPCKRTNLSPKSMQPVKLKIRAQQAANWHRKQIAILPIEKIPETRVARTISTTQWGKFDAPFCNASDNITTTIGTRDKVAQVFLLKEIYERFEIEGDNFQVINPDDKEYVHQTKHMMDLVSNPARSIVARALLLATKTQLDELTTESNFPVEYKDGKRQIIDPQSHSEEHDEYMPDMSMAQEALNPEQLERAKQIMHDNKDVFAKNKNDLGETHLLEHEIELLDEHTA